MTASKTAGFDADQSVVSDSEYTGPDYLAVDVPTNRSPTDYNFNERRRCLLDQIRELGHPSLLPRQEELADEFGVSQQQISKDLDRIAEYVSACHLANRDRRALVVDSVMDKCVRELLRAGEYRQAARTIMEWSEWADSRDLDALEARVERTEAAIDEVLADGATGISQSGVVIDT